MSKLPEPTLADLPAARPIRFIHRGQVVSVDHVDPTRTLLDWLREDARCTGTKEGCNEGDCGACTVVLAQLDDARGTAGAGDGAVRPQTPPALRLAAVNACMRFLPTVDGCVVFTVEDLAEIAAAKLAAGGVSTTDTAPRTALHPVQQAMRDCHASQCGFCTPGFVMSLWAQYEAVQGGAPKPDRQALADALAGNLCRCTGYRPILDAGERMFGVPSVPLARTPVIESLKALRATNDNVGGDFVYIRGDGAGARFVAPTSSATFARLRAALPEARVLAGATDISLWVNKQFRSLGDLIYVGRVAEFEQIAEVDGELRIGAAVSLERAWACIADRWPGLTELWLRFAAPPVRNAGTLVGNLANGSPIGDSAPALIALGARLELRRAERVRFIAIEDFYLDYMKNALEPGEFVQAVRIPAPGGDRHVFGWKISKRYDSDISAVCLGAMLRLEAGAIADIRLAFGGMAAIVRRAAHAEAALIGKLWTQDAVREAQQALARDFAPITDMRGSAGWRLKIAANLIERLWWRTRADNPLSDAELRVFPQREALT